MYKGHYTRDFWAARYQRHLVTTMVEVSDMSLSDEDKGWIRSELERVETNLLTEFHKWASPVEARQRSHTAALRAFDLEMESLSDRVQKLESGPPNGGAA
jgi:hypothetical protein